MFNNLPKLTKILTQENPMQKVLFHLSKSASSIKNFSSYKKPWAIYKISLRWICGKRFAVRKIIVDFLELSMFINVSLPKICYLMKWIGDLDMEKTFC